jgi:hypothetical protein
MGEQYIRILDGANQMDDDQPGKKSYLIHRISFIFIAINIIIGQAVSCIIGSLEIIDSFHHFLPCTYAFNEFNKIMLYYQKFNSLITGMFLIIIIHYLAKQTKEAPEEDFS